MKVFDGLTNVGRGKIAKQIIGSSGVKRKFQKHFGGSEHILGKVSVPT